MQQAASQPNNSSTQPNRYLNARVPVDTLSTTRRAATSASVPSNDKQFLIIECDNRGVGVDNPTGAAPIASKRIYKININGATDVRP